MSKLLDILLIANEEEIRKRNKELKSEPNNDIQVFLRENEEKQKKAIEDDFIPNPYFMEYNLEYKWVELVNNITSTIFKNRPGRTLKYLVMDRDYGFIYGLVSVASPMLNSKLTRYIKEKTDLNKVDFGYLNNHVIDMNVCIGVGPLTSLLTGKLQAYMVLSDFVINEFNTKYNTQIKYILTTSLYGKSSIYNRIKEFKYLGLSSGYNSLFTKEQIAWIKSEYKIIYPNRAKNKTAKAPHLMRLYEHLWKHHKGNMPFFPLKTERGVYIYDSELNPIKQIQDQIEFWKARWYYPRKERLKIQ